MGLFSFGKPNQAANKLIWNSLNTVEGLEQAILNSVDKPSLFFKHSTRCSISSMALNRFENAFSADNSRCNLYFIDLIAYRDVSDEIAEKLNVLHQSPQVIVLDNHQVIYTASHSGIDAQQIETIL
jgi:bacillithiol system protein YtxJ